MAPLRKAIVCAILLAGILLGADPVTDFWAPYRALLAEGTLTTAWESEGQVFLAGAFQYRKMHYDPRWTGWVSEMSNRLAGAVVPMERSQALAFWANAHNYGCLAEVLTRTRTPMESGVDESRRFLVIAGGTWSLEEVERKCLWPLHEPLLIYALHRGAVSGGRVPRDILHPATLTVVLSNLARESLKSPLFLRPNPERTRLRASEAFAWTAGMNLAPVPRVLSNALVPFLAEPTAAPVTADIPYDGRLNDPESVFGRLEALAMQESHLHLRRLPAGDTRNPASTPRMQPSNTPR